MLQVDFELSNVEYNVSCFYMCLFIVIYIICCFMTILE